MKKNLDKVVLKNLSLEEDNMNLKKEVSKLRDQLSKLQTRCNSLERDLDSQECKPVPEKKLFSLESIAKDDNKKIDFIQDWRTK